MSYQPHLSPALPKVAGNKDYAEFQDQLLRIDEILVGGIEGEFVKKYLACYEEELLKEGTSYLEKIFSIITNIPAKTESEIE